MNRYERLAEIEAEEHAPLEGCPWCGQRAVKPEEMVECLACGAILKNERSVA